MESAKLNSRNGLKGITTLKIYKVLSTVMESVTSQNLLKRNKRAEEVSAYLFAYQNKFVRKEQYRSSTSHNDSNGTPRSPNGPLEPEHFLSTLPPSRKWCCFKKEWPTPEEAKKNVMQLKKEIDKAIDEMDRVIEKEEVGEHGHHDESSNNNSKSSDGKF